jgi:2-octaprenyl-6-methoxyphenol hydroxylase
MNTAAQVQCDIAICGGGLVGATLALALRQLNFDVLLIEAHAPQAQGHPSFDDRTTALSNGSRRILEALQVWPLVAREATPIKRIHVSDQGRFGFARLDAAEQGIEALGFVITNRVLGAALWRRLKEQDVSAWMPARISNAALNDGRHEISCTTDQGQRTVFAKLAIAADGAQSIVRTEAGINAEQWDYQQHALIANVVTQRFHDHVAYERFTAEGPLALLPLNEGRLGLIWTFHPDMAKTVAAFTDAQFLSKLQDAFGFRLGRFTHVGSRQMYPLSLTRSETHIAKRLAIVGNAAQSLHPIAGQGFNLGLRDAASLAEVLADGRRDSPTAFDPGDGMWLDQYRQWRAADQQGIVRFTDGLVRVFTQPFAPIKALRDLGLLAFDLMPSAKSALAQLSLGAAGRIPKLARGAKLL